MGYFLKAMSFGCGLFAIGFTSLIKLVFERKKLKTFYISALFMILAVIFLAAFVLFFPLPARADLYLLKESIIAYNHEHHQESLSDGSYGGEEGILRVRPEVGRSLGLKVLMDKEYIEVMALFKKADALLEKIEKALTTQEKEEFPGEHVKKVCEFSLEYNTALRSAQEGLMAYRLRLTPEIDDRVNKEICSELLEKILRESLKRAACNLRDALGFFYNKCQDLDEGNGPLNVENIKFVNYVVQEFKEKATEETLKRFHLDKQKNISVSDVGPRWKFSLGRAESRYIPFVEAVVEEQKSGYTVDVLLFLALLKQESKFNPHAVSQVGAVGLTQIMPSTAKGLGMKNVFEPSYFREAGIFMGRERNLKNRAMKLILEITDKNILEPARRARELMQDALKYKEMRIKLYTRYKKELLKNGKDDRLDPQKSIEYGFKYFASVMKQQKGDISLALASYNAGPHRVKQYKGIPPYAETIQFRNRVLRYYRGYLHKLNFSRSGFKACLESMGIPDDRSVSEKTEADQHLP